MTRKLFLAMLAYCWLLPALAEVGVDEIQPAPMSNGTDITTTYFGPPPSSAEPELIGPLQVQTASLPAITNVACETHSGTNTAALIELYTSEGCSSCPPADKQLSRLPQTLDPTAQVVPLALHVGYWDNLGWIDPYAQDRFAQRQTRLVQFNRHLTVYTPQFFVGGNELQAWQGSLRKAVHHLNAMPAVANIRLRSAVSMDGMLTLDVMVTTQKAGDDPTALYLAIAENGLLSKVTAGENRSATLKHNHLVRKLIGPIRLYSSTTRAQREISLPATWHQDRLEIITFVQNENSGAVLQALRADLCTGA